MSFFYGNIQIQTREILGRVHFDAQTYRALVGYSSLSGIRHHTGKLFKEADGTQWITLGQIQKVASGVKSVRSRGAAKAFYKAASQYLSDLVTQTLAKAVKKVDVKSDELFSIADVANYVGMKTKELQDWLVAKGFCGLYANGNLKLNNTFRDQGYAKKPKAASGKESNVVRLTIAGKEFVKNRIRSERENSVLSFAKTTVNEEARLEKAIDAIIESTFEPYKYNDGTFGKAYYDLDIDDLKSKVKIILAKVKLKEV